MIETSKPAGQLVPVGGAENGQLVPTSWLPHQGPAGHITRIDTSDERGRMLVFRLLTESGMNANELINVPVRVVNYLLSPAQFLDKDTGEEVATVVTRLTLDDGRWVETHSNGILKTLGTLIQLMGDAPWPKGIAVTIRRKPLRGERSWLVLELTPTNAKGGK